MFQTGWNMSEPPPTSSTMFQLRGKIHCQPGQPTYFAVLCPCFQAVRPPRRTKVHQKSIAYTCWQGTLGKYLDLHWVLKLLVNFFKPDVYSSFYSTTQWWAELSVFRLFRSICAFIFRIFQSCITWGHHGAMGPWGWHQGLGTKLRLSPRDMLRYCACVAWAISSSQGRKIAETWRCEYAKTCEHSHMFPYVAWENRKFIT